MENPIIEKGREDNYKEAREKAQSFYGEIHQLWCPALKDYVVFSRIGFQHLIRPKNIQRPKSEQKRRFALLPLVKAIIENPKASVKHQRKQTIHIVKLQGEKTSVSSYADFWEFIEKQDGQTIKAVIRQFPHGKKHFLSIYAKKEKPSSP